MVLGSAVSETACANKTTAQSHLLPAQFAQLSARPREVGVRGVLCVLLPNGREVSGRVLRSRRAFQLHAPGGQQRLGYGHAGRLYCHLDIFRVIAVAPELVLEVHVGVTVQEEYNLGL